ncbi:MAG: hypothetical protein ACJAZS_000604 [Alteromonas naphthalenivorans]|jgi:hypothetical protein
MKKFIYLLVFMSVGFVSVKPVKAAPAKKATTTTAAAKAAPTGSTKGASSVGMASSSDNSSATSLNFTGAKPGAGITDSSGDTDDSGDAAGGGTQSANQVSNGYTVEPADANPMVNSQSLGYDGLVTWMKDLLINQGYLTLACDCGGKNNKSPINVSLATVDGFVKGNFGSYATNGDFKAVSKGTSLNHNQNFVKNLLTTGAYKIDQAKLLKGIQAGKFSGDLLTSRLLVQEFYLGQLAVTVPAIATGTALSKADRTFVAGIGTKLAEALKQTRYLRNGVQMGSQVNRYMSTSGKGTTFTPVDFFAGAIVINNSQNVINSNGLQLSQGGVGFFPVPSGSYMNNWSNAAQGSATGLPTREAMTLDY